MKKYFFYMVLGIQLFSGSFSGIFCAVHKILFIGDSITQGKGCLPGFRDNVYQDLYALRYPFEFVGSVDASSPYRAFCFNSAVIPDFYKNNGQYNIIGEMNQYKPDIVVIHLGTNDFWLYDQTIQGGPYSTDGGLTFTEQVSGHMAKLLALLAQWHDGRRGTHLETIFLCQIIPKTWRHMGEKGIPMLNADLVRLTEDAEAGRVPSIPPGLICLVDQFSTFTNDMFSDDNHPNCSGYRHMAGIFYDAFKTLPMYLLAADGADQRVLPGSPLPLPITFKVTDGFGSPAPDVPVAFDITWGDGLILSDSVTLSDSTGLVYVNLAMGQSDSCILRAHTSGLIDSIATQILHTRNSIYLSGQITYSGNGIPVSDVKIRWQEQESEVLSDQTGHFRIDEVPIHTSVTLIPEKATSAQQDADVHIYEAALIARHVVGLVPFNLFQMQAADIDGNGQVSMADAALIARLVVGLESPQNTALGNWIFSPSVMHLDTDAGDVDSLKITAIRIGDIFQPADNNTGDSDYHVQIGEEKLSKSSESTASLQVPVRVTGSNISAAEFTIRWDAGQAVFQGVREIPPGFSVYYKQNREDELEVALFSSGSISGSVNLFSLAFDGGEYRMIDVQIGEAFINDQEVHGLTTIAETIDVQDKDGIGYNFPNPFNGETLIPFTLAREEQVRISIVNILGQTINVVSEKTWSTGRHQVLWDGRDEQGVELSSGVYFIVFETGRQSIIKRMELLR